MRMALGPSLGQCCGGVVHLSLQRVNAQDAATLCEQLDTPRMPVALFGGGHVGHALAELLARLPVALHWIDSREGIFPDALPAHVVCEHSEPVQGAVASLAPDSRVLIMSFSHAEDLDVLALCLTRQRQPDQMGKLQAPARSAWFHLRRTRPCHLSDRRARHRRQRARGDCGGRGGAVAASSPNKAIICSLTSPD
jgi:xanthine dehydrogenase accessory factor